MATTLRDGTQTSRGRTRRKTRAAPSASRPDCLPIAVRRHPMIALVSEGLRRCGIEVSRPKPAKPMNLLVGVSGGADSVALLLAFTIISRRKSGSHLCPIAVHVHHHLRGEADEDAQWVESLCNRFGIPFRLMHIHPASLAGNMYANARRLRYAALYSLAVQEDAPCVAVAHHAEDQLETMIAALCRGTGLNGLCGMPWRRRLYLSQSKTESAAHHVQLIRPLLEARKSDCEALCHAASITWRIDVHNADATRMRARLRRDVLPVLESLWPQAPRHATATGDVLRIAQRALRQRVNQAFGQRTQTQWDRKRLAGLPLALIAEGLRRAASVQMPRVKDQLSQRQVLLAARSIRSTDRAPRLFDWPAGVRVTVTSKQVKITTRADHKRAMQQERTRD